MKYFLSFVFALSPLLSHAQQNKIDSLVTLLKTDKEDTNKVNHLNVLGRELMYINPDTAIILSNNALVILSEAKNLNEKEKQKHVANTLGNLGVYYSLKADYPKALDYYQKALKIDEELNNKKGIATRLGSIGIVYFNQADYPKALDYYFKALKMAEELGNKNNIAVWLGNIGIVYKYQADYPKALDYYFRALKMAEELGNKNSITVALGNIGFVYKEQAEAHPNPSEREGLYTKALDYYFRAFKLAEELGYKNNIAVWLGNIGNVYDEQATSFKSQITRDTLFTKALDYYFKALKMNEELGRKNGIAINLGNIGSIYTKTGKFAEAEKYLLDALKIDKEIGAQNEERNFEESLSQLYEKTGKFNLALEHYKKAMVLKDTLFSEEKNKELTKKELNYEFEKKEAATKAEQDKKDAVTQIIIYSVSSGFALVLLLAVFIFRGYRQKQKANIIISEQKLIVEEKQKEILDSIHYAKRIQQSLLPTEKYIDKTLKRLNG